MQKPFGNFAFIWAEVAPRCQHEKKMRKSISGNVFWFLGLILERLVGRFSRRCNQHFGQYFGTSVGRISVDFGQEFGSDLLSENGALEARRKPSAANERPHGGRIASKVSLKVSHISPKIMQGTLPGIWMDHFLIPDVGHLLKLFVAQM